MPLSELRVPHRFASAAHTGSRECGRDLGDCSRAQILAMCLPRHLPELRSTPADTSSLPRVMGSIEENMYAAVEPRITTLNPFEVVLDESTWTMSVDFTLQMYAPL
jgi:hypothetical protein